MFLRIGECECEQIEEVIEVLIVLLDVIDGDPDLEPSLGLNGHRLNDIPDLEGDDYEDEPSLGSAEGIFSQVNWSAGPRDDLEDQCDDEGEPGDKQWQEKRRLKRLLARA